ncbi:MAG: hypothetical protein GY774_31630, partial [Planctomycetes bacterium]|nr:hypothetical protein [Planctomycetota bacterium]
MLDFSKLEKPEGLTDAMLSDSKVQAFVQGLIDTQITAAVSVVKGQLETMTQAKVIADQKVEDVKGKLDAALKVKPGDNTEHTAALEALQTQLTEKDTEMGKLNASLDRADVTQYLNNEIAAYNAANPTVTIASGAESYILESALATFKKNEQGQILPFNGEAVLTGQNGFMTGVEFITKLRTVKLFAFNKPAGGGASGGQDGFAGNKGMTR